MIFQAYDQFLVGYRHYRRIPSSTVNGWINSTSQFYIYIEDQYMLIDCMQSISEHWRNSKFQSGTALPGNFVTRSMRGKIDADR